MSHYERHTCVAICPQPRVPDERAGLAWRAKIRDPGAARAGAPGSRLSLRSDEDAFTPLGRDTRFRNALRSALLDGIEVGQNRCNVIGFENELWHLGVSY